MSKENPADPGVFLIVNPVWVLAEKSGEQLLTSGRDLGTAGVAAGWSKKGQFLFAFTDEDLARRHVQASQAEEKLTPVPFTQPRDFYLFLQALLASGVTRVAFDPKPSGKKVQFFEIATMLQEATNQGVL